MLRKTKMLALAFMLSMSSAPAALAQVDNAVLERLKAIMAKEGTPISWEKVETFDNSDGDEVTALMKVKIKVAENDVELDTIELSNVTSEKGGYKIGLLTVPEQHFEEGDVSIDVSDITVEGLTLPAEGQKGAFGGIVIYDMLGIGTITASSKGKEVFSLSDFHAEISPDEAAGTMGFSGAAESFTVNFEQVNDPTSRMVIDGLGYKTIEGYLSLEGEWNSKSGDLSISQYDITVNDAGTLGIAVDLGGYTPEFIEQMKKIQEQMAAADDKDNSAHALALLGLMQQLTFKNAAITFEDDSLTKKVINYVAKQQKAKPADITNQAKAIVPFMLMQLNNPEFSQAATKAVSDFLDNPKNLAITAKPASPVPFALIAASAMTAPQSLIKQLSVSVLANQ